jgi:hypothetical protein
MKHNKLNLESNVSSDDARAGYKTPRRTDEINKACNKFLESRGVSTSFFQKNKKCPTKP